MPLSKNIVGIWIIRTQKHLQEFVETPELNHYDTTNVAGWCGRLMSRVRKLEVIDYPKLVVLASDIGIMQSSLKNTVIPTLQKNGILNVYRDNSGSILRIEEDVPNTDAIFPLVTEIWESNQPEEVEFATMDAQELCSRRPQLDYTLRQDLKSCGYKEEVTDLSIELQSSYQILGSVDHQDGKLIYSEYIWGKVMQKGGKWMSQLDTNQEQKIRNMVELVNNNQGIPTDIIQHSEDLSVAKRAGLLRVCPVKTASAEEKNFAFAPSVGQVYNDESDEVKTFLACLRYGEHYSQTSRILNPTWIIDALLDRDTHTIGPATDIGTDYILLEKAGIVKVERAENYPDRYTMTLIKEDVAKQVREILVQGTVSGLEQESFAPILTPNSLTTAEQSRIRMGKLPSSVTKAQEELFKVLRRENY